MPTERITYPGKRRVGRGLYRREIARQRMHEAHVGSAQQQPVAVEVRPEEAIVAALSVRGVADDRVIDVLDVTAQLMASAGDRK